MLFRSSLKQEEGDAIEISEVAVTESGLQFTLPKDLPAGTYTVSLIRGVQSWTLEGTLNVQKEKRIKSISVENAMGKIDITMTSFNPIKVFDVPVTFWTLPFSRIS